MNALAVYGNPLMDAGLRTYIMKIHFVNPIAKKKYPSNDMRIRYRVMTNSIC